MEIQDLKKEFINLYGDGDIECFFSPSRVNLIGEHIDYNGGKVLPLAIEIGTYGLVRRRDDEVLNFISLNMDLKIKTEIGNIVYKKEDGWANYPKGVISIMMEEGFKAGGMDILIYGNIPNGAGLSSSASLELLMAEMLNSLFNAGKIDPIKLVKISQRAENEFVGVNCGIMDQFIIGMGKKDKAILLDTDTLDFSYVDMDLKDYTLVIMNTNKRRELSDSKYNERRDECERALDILEKHKSIRNLCDLSPEEFEQIKYNLRDDVLERRAEHVVYENARVYRAYDALKKGDIKHVGELLKQSHKSLKDLYEVTGEELDTIVDIANRSKFSVGSRMTGAGFGGCAISIVEKDKAGQFIEEVGAAYKKAIGYEAEFYQSDVGDGTKKISENQLK